MSSKKSLSLVKIEDDYLVIATVNLITPSLLEFLVT